MRRKHMRLIEDLKTMYNVGDAFYASQAVERLGSKAPHPTVVAWCVKMSPYFGKVRFNSVTSVYQWRRVL